MAGNKRDYITLQKMRILYNVYQICVALPLLIFITLATAVITIVGCTIGNGRFWGYYPAAIWSWLFCRILLLPVEVEGRENIDSKTSYIFVANHQGAFDIFLIFGFLRHQFRWMMKKSLEKIPFVGYACKKAKHIFVDQSTPTTIYDTMKDAYNILQGGMSVVVFPEGTRSKTGKMGRFRKGGFLLADYLQLPIVPITLDGPFQVLPRTKDITFVKRHKLHMIIHKPIFPQEKGKNDINALTEQSYQVIHNDLPDSFK